MYVYIDISINIYALVDICIYTYVYLCIFFTAFVLFVDKVIKHLYISI